MGHETNPVKAIRAKCIDCSGGMLGEVRNCPIKGARCTRFGWVIIRFGRKANAR